MTKQQIVTVEGYRFAVRTANENMNGPCVIFLHGILGTVDFWPELLSDDLLQSFPHASISLPYHLPAEGNQAPFKLDLHQLPKLLLRVIDEHVTKGPLALIGWSTGAFAELLLAATNPERTRSVLGFAGFAQGRWRGLLGQLQKLAAGGRMPKLLAQLSLRVLQSSRAAFMLANRTAANEPNAFAQGSIARDLLMDQHEQFRKFNAAQICELIGAIRNFDISPQMSAINCPVTLVAGQQDAIIRYEHGKQLAALIPTSRFIALPNTGHTFFTDPECEYETIIRDWLIEQELWNTHQFAA